MSMNRISHYLFRIAFLLCPFIRIRVHNSCTVPRVGPVLLVPHHQKMFDILAITWSILREVRYMAKISLFKNWLLRKYLEACGAFRVKQGEPDRGALRKAGELLGSGEAVCIFGEGTRTPGNVVGEMHGGLILAANLSKVDPWIVPCGISYKWTWRFEVEVYYGNGFRISDINDTSASAIEIIRSRVQRAQDEAVKRAA